MPSNASQSGRAFGGRRPDLWYFDKLPPTARTALANAAFNWASGAFYNAWQRGEPGFATGPDIAACVAEADAEQIARDRIRVWKIE
jgi:Family of unknown function (DUF6525)